MVPYDLGDVNNDDVVIARDPKTGRLHEVEEELYCGWPEVIVNPVEPNENAKRGSGASADTERINFYMYYSTMLKESTEYSPRRATTVVYIETHVSNEGNIFCQNFAQFCALKTKSAISSPCLFTALTICPGALVFGRRPIRVPKQMAGPLLKHNSPLLCRTEQNAGDSFAPINNGEKFFPQRIVISCLTVMRSSRHWPAMGLTMASLTAFDGRRYLTSTEQRAPLPRQSRAIGTMILMFCVINAYFSVLILRIPT
ncbi:hypothetical protein ACHAW5_002691 [Stephanodiscus triporus]|uniref:Uncharacterized protein n=1 Tax=Stephanodiscus triporus TaxID=2934178 RepID=A0ABD3N4E0_9STRA